MTLGEALTEGIAYLDECGIADARMDGWLLLEYVTGISRASFLADRGRQMETEAHDRYRKLLEQRGQHIPLQHLTGEQEFMGFSFLVNEHVLVPRQDTEVLVEEALRQLQPGMRVLDLCTGSGCIAISLKKLSWGIDVDASDLSKEALRVAGENGRRLNAQIDWYEGDLLAPVQKNKYDMIVSNPPYIRTAVIEELSEEVRLHEPYQALDGKEDGLYFYRRITAESSDVLKAGGRLLFEIGCDQAEDVMRLMAEAGYREIRTSQDLAGLDRVVQGVR